MTMHISYSVKKKCWNSYDSYGEICVHCGCCSADPLERAKARLAICEEQLEERQKFDVLDDDPKWREVQEKNVKSDIRYFKRRIRYYRQRVAALEESEWDDYDHCYECRGLGDDYIINDNGELESFCDQCGWNQNRGEGDA